jgi:hypothetical protein
MQRAPTLPRGRVRLYPHSREFHRVRMRDTDGRIGDAAFAREGG